MFNKLLASLPIFSKVSLLKKDLESLSRQKWKISFDSHFLKRDFKNFREEWQSCHKDFSQHILSSFSQLSTKIFRVFSNQVKSYGKNSFKNESFFSSLFSSKEKSLQSQLPKKLSLGLEVGKDFLGFMNDRILESKNHQWKQMKDSDDIFLKEYENLKKQEIDTYQNFFMEESNSLQQKKALYADSFLNGESSKEFFSRQLLQFDQIFQKKQNSLFSKNEEVHNDLQQMQEYMTQKHDLFNQKKDLMSGGLMPWEKEEFDRTETQLRQVYRDIDFLDNKQAVIDNQLQSLFSQKETNFEKPPFHISGFSQERIPQQPKAPSVVNVSLNIQASNLTPDQISQEVVRSLVSRIRSEANKGSLGGL